LGLVKVDIRFDTGVMLDAMVQQARMVVFKAVASATSATKSIPLDTQIDPMITTDHGLTPTLSGFSSALNISAGTPQTPPKAANNSQLQKSRASALKLNSVLQSDFGKPKGNSTFDKTKKTKSVQWNNQMDLPEAKPSQDPLPKRQRLSTEARLRSFKSFGRAHAGDLDNGPKVRNATFGDFGSQQPSGSAWGRNGKLANHPAPMQPDYDQSQDLLSTETITNKNATFDLQRPPLHLTSRIDLGKKSRSGIQQDQSSIPRSATAHENWLVENTLGSTL
jgi:hypothetical protein